MDAALNQNIAAKQGAADSGRYFQYMAQFIGFSAADAETIQQTKPIIEKHLPELVTQFYSHLLRHPPTRSRGRRSPASLCCCWRAATSTARSR